MFAVAPIGRAEGALIDGIVAESSLNRTSEKGLGAHPM